MAAKLSGYRRLPGAERAYITPEGERISYRAYRNKLESAGLVERLDPVSLANARRRQRAFNDIVNQMADVKRRALETQIENSRRAGRTLETASLQTQYRRAKAEAKKSPDRKEALKILGQSHHGKNPQAEKLALKILGRREGVPDWVPVGSSTKFKEGKLRRAA